MEDDWKIIILTFAIQMTSFKYVELISISDIDALLVVRESNHVYSDKSAPSKHLEDGD